MNNNRGRRGLVVLAMRKVGGAFGAVVGLSTKIRRPL
jgi:hypothetical protein